MGAARVKQYRPAPPQFHCHVNKIGDAWFYQPCMADNGGTGPHHKVGPAWPTGKAAYRFMERYEQRHLNPSPLRVEASPLDAKQSPPPASVLASNEAASA